MKLKVIFRYQNRGLVFDKDSVIDVDPPMAQFLLNDAPGCFKAVKEKPVKKDIPESPVEGEAVDPPVEKELTSPPVDKMIHEGNITK